MQSWFAKKVYGTPLPWFLGFLAVIFAGAMLETIPNKLMGGFAICLVFGIGLNWLGDRIPVWRDFGGGTIFAVLIPALLLYLGILPESVAKIGKDFFSGYDYTTWLVPSLLIGSILGMERQVLVSAGIRFFVAMSLTIVSATLLSGLAGWFFGYGFIQTMLFIAGPILGSGVAASAVPLSEIYADFAGGNSADYLTTLTSSVMIANILTILCAAWLASLGRRNKDMFVKGFSGEGKILRHSQDEVLTEEEKAQVVADPNSARFSDLQTGFVTTCAFYIFGTTMQRFVPSLHFYLWMILPAIAFKLFRSCPADLERAAGAWTRFMAKVLTPCALAAISVGALDLGQLVGLFADPTYMILCLICVLVTVVTSGIIAYCLGFYFVEGSIMTGLGLADMGGTGDVAVLSAANRMELLPFLTICSRIGGAMNMVWLTFLASRFL